jgi:predicted membrane channel-forming protein YqfA (hemolysin III family)
MQESGQGGKPSKQGTEQEPLSRWVSPLIWWAMLTIAVLAVAGLASTAAMLAPENEAWQFVLFVVTGCAGALVCQWLWNHLG